MPQIDYGRVMAECAQRIRTMDSAKLKVLMISFTPGSAPLAMEEMAKIRRFFNNLTLDAQDFYTSCQRKVLALGCSELRVKRCLLENGKWELVIGLYNIIKGHRDIFRLPISPDSDLAEEVLTSLP